MKFSFAPRMFFLASLAKGAVVFEVRPSPTCDNCLEYMREAFLPFVEAGLPGDQIQVVVVPWPGEQALDEVSAAGVFEGENDAVALQVCAMRNALAQPAPIDSPAMVSAVRFIACDDAARMAGASPEARLQTCAAQADMPYEGADGAKMCADPEEGFKIMRDGTYSALVTATRGRPYSGPPHVFLNGEPLNCPSLTFCDSTGGQRVAGTAGITGATPLEVPGTLRDIACSFLDAPHPACEGAATAADAEQHANSGPTTTYCENCRLRAWEVGRAAKRWLPVHTGLAQPPPALCAALVAVLCVAGWAVASRRRWSRESESGRRHLRGEPDEPDDSRVLLCE